MSGINYDKLSAELQLLVDDGANSFTAQDKENLLAFLPTFSGWVVALHGIREQGKSIKSLYDATIQASHDNIPDASLLQIPRDRPGVLKMEHPTAATSDVQKIMNAWTTVLATLDTVTADEVFTRFRGLVD